MDATNSVVLIRFCGVAVLAEIMLIIFLLLGAELLFQFQPEYFVVVRAGYSTRPVPRGIAWVARGVSREMMRFTRVRCSREQQSRQVVVVVTEYAENRLEP